MMPEADIVALSGSVSNQRSRKSAALIVMSWMKVACSRRGRAAKSRARPPRARLSLGSGRRGSLGVMARMGLTKRAMRAMSGPYWAYASASLMDQRRSSRSVCA